MSRSVGSGTDKVLRQWEQANERKEMSQEISKFFKESLGRKKSAGKKSKAKTKSTRGKKK